MKTYKITFQMESPICFIDRPNFDGMLIYCYMKEKYGNIKIDLGLKGDQLSTFPDLPIPYHPDGFPIASIMFFDTSEAIEYTGSWKKRWDNKNDDLADFKKRVRKVRVNAGSFKSYDMPLNLWHVPEVWFYFQSDDIQRVQQLLLTQLAGIGKKVSQGYGFYSRFDIAEEEEVRFDTHVLRPLKKGTASTILTVNNTIEKQEKVTLHSRYCAWRPPYHNPENFTDCIYPGDRI